MKNKLLNIKHKDYILSIRDRIERQIPRYSEEELYNMFEASHEISEAYGSRQRLNQGCHSCIGQVLKQLRNWLKMYDEHSTSVLSGTQSLDNDYESMKWGEFRKYCKSLGLDTKGKTREELTNILKQ